MFVKICGVTRADDARAAVAAGARAIGFVFWPGSPRFIDPYRAREIVSAIPPFVTTVGVFVNQSVHDVNGVAAVAGVSAVQLHGDEEPAFAAAVRRPVIKALGRVDDEIVRRWPAHIQLLVDAPDRVRRGGTGEVADWAAAARVASTRPLLLAGGLSAANAAEAVAQVHPFGLDVSSGVESRPGIKDHVKITAFFQALHHS